MLRTRFANIEHKWFFDLPWHMVDLKDWFYMVNVGDLDPVYYLHVRIAGIRSLWVINIPNPRNLTLRGAFTGQDTTVYDKTANLCKDCGKSTYMIVQTGREGYMVCPICGGCPDDDIKY